MISNKNLSVFHDLLPKFECLLWSFLKISSAFHGFLRKFAYFSQFFDKISVFLLSFNIFFFAIFDKICIFLLIFCRYLWSLDKICVYYTIFWWNSCVLYNLLTKFMCFLQSFWWNSHFFWQNLRFKKKKSFEAISAFFLSFDRVLFGLLLMKLAIFWQNLQSFDEIQIFFVIF